jgi:FkbM family methyltransferase
VRAGNGEFAVIRRFLERRRARIAAALLPVKRAMLGDEIMVGVDVGSAGGMQPHWRAYEGVLDFYCFEPHEASFRRLTEAYAKHPERKKFRVLPIGLSGGGGERTLYMLNTPTGSSLYPVNTESEFVDAGDGYIYPVRETVIGTRKLEEVLDEQRVEGVDIIKLDVQGAELEILQGLGDARRKRLLLAELEINISGGVTRNFSTYRGAPSWLDCERLLAEDGMRLLDISVARSYRANKGDDDWYQREVFDVYRNTPTLAAHAWETDAVYVRDWRALIRDRDAAGIRKLAVALCGYRFFSEAYFMVQKGEEAGVLTPDAGSELRRNIVAWHRAGRRPWHGRGRVWTLVRRMLRNLGVSQLLRWKQYMWFDYPNG